MAAARKYSVTPALLLSSLLFISACWSLRDLKGPLADLARKEIAAGGFGPCMKLPKELVASIYPEAKGRVVTCSLTRGTSMVDVTYDEDKYVLLVGSWLITSASSQLDSSFMRLKANFETELGPATPCESAQPSDVELHWLKDGMETALIKLVDGTVRWQRSAGGSPCMTHRAPAKAS